MYLSGETASHKDTICTSYFFAESYRTGGKGKPQNIWQTERLTDALAAPANVICTAMTDPDYVVTGTDQIIVENSTPFMNMRVAASRLDEWRLSRSFPASTQSSLRTPLMAKVLTIHKPVSPYSHDSTHQWVVKSPLSDVERPRN